MLQCQGLETHRKNSSAPGSSAPRGSSIVFSDAARVMRFPSMTMVELSSGLSPLLSMRPSPRLHGTIVALELLSLQVSQSRFLVALS